MFRYVGLIWDPADRAQSDAADGLEGRLRGSAPGWHEVFRAAGARVFCAQMKPPVQDAVVLNDGGGVIVGTLFERNSDAEDGTSCRRVAISVATSHAIVESRGKWLTERCWGNYVAFVTLPAGGEHARASALVLKDPAGDLPCFTTRHRNVDIVFSNIGDLLDAGLRFTLNREFLVAHMIMTRHRAQPALLGVREIFPGEAVELPLAQGQAQQAPRFYWQPRWFAESADPIEDAATAARALRATTLACAGGWAHRHRTILHRLSGGLDSSIVAGCLKAASGDEKVVCYTYFHPGSRADERRWARMAAAHCGFELSEYPVQPAEWRFDLASDIPASVEPLTLLGYLQRSTVEKQAVERCQATAVFSGDGGDSGFCAESIGHAVSGYIARHGVDFGVFRLASQVALSTQQSLLAVLMKAMRRRFGIDPQRDHTALLAHICRLLAPELRAAREKASHVRELHPWFDSQGADFYDTARRSGTLIGASHFYNARHSQHEMAPELVAPLYSQPVVEVMLRIPIHTHFFDGRSRGLARSAFAAEVPDPILQRLWKDRVPGFFEQTLALNRVFFRELLLDGVLMAEGLLDRRAVEDALSDGPSKSEVRVGEIIRHVDTELWARQWARRSCTSTISESASMFA